LKDKGNFIIKKVVENKDLEAERLVEEEEVIEEEEKEY